MTNIYRAARFAGGVWRLSLQTCSTYIIFASPSQAPFNGSALRTACSTNTAKPFASQAARGSACDIHGTVQGDAAAAAYRREQTVRVQVQTSKSVSKYGLSKLGDPAVPPGQGPGGTS